VEKWEGDVAWERSDECRRKNGQARLSLLCSGCAKHNTLPRLRNVTSNFRASSGYFEPKRVCDLWSHRVSVSPAVELVTRRGSPPPWSVEENSACFISPGRDGAKLPSRKQEHVGINQQRYSPTVLTTLDSGRVLLVAENLSWARTMSSYFASVVTGAFGTMCTSL
jgi:hypothetical protein